MKHFAVVAGSRVLRILPLLAALAVSLFAGEGMAQEGFAERVVTLCQAAGRTPPNFGDTNNTKCATCHSNWQSPAKSNLNAKGLAFQGGNVLATFCPGAPVPPPTPAPTRFNLSVVRYGTGYVGSEPSAIDCGGQCVASLPAKSTVKLTASPGVGFNFSGWTGACSGTAGQCTVRMDGNKTVSAVFAAQGVASCGTANNTAAAEPPPFDALCQTGFPSEVESLATGRFGWTCQDAASGVTPVRCYTLASDGSPNQAPLALTPGSATVTVGGKVAETVVGGTGKSAVKYKVTSASAGAACKLTPGGRKVTIKAKSGPGVCSITAVKSRSKLNGVRYPEVESAPIVIKIIAPGSQ